MRLVLVHLPVDGCVMRARTRKDWILWSALGCALAGTAHAEYTLAVAAHFNEWVALAVPGALDLYVIRALQQRRDVFVAVLAMVAANVAAHLVVAGVLPVEWPVVSAVGAVAPLIVWRVYALKYTRTRQELLWGLEAGAGPEDTGAVSAPVLEHECGWVRRALDWLGWRECGCALAPAEVLVAGQGLEYGPRMKWGALEPAPAWVPGFHLDGCDGQHALESPGACFDRASALGSAPSAPAPDRIPEWMADEYPPSTPHSKTSAVPYLAPVPDLPPEYAPGAVHSESPLTASDWDYLPGAQKYVDDVADPSVRGLKRELRIGQERAERLLTHLGVIL